MEKPESYVNPEVNVILQHLTLAAGTMYQLRMYDLLDRLEELMGDVEEEALKRAIIGL